MMRWRFIRGGEAKLTDFGQQGHSRQKQRNAAPEADQVIQRKSCATCAPPAMIWNAAFMI